jgi:hypothetical protein
VVRGLDLQRVDREAGVTCIGKQFRSDINRGHPTANRLIKPDGLDGDTGHDTTATSNQLCHPGLGASASDHSASDHRSSNHSTTGHAAYDHANNPTGRRRIRLLKSIRTRGP